MGGLPVREVLGGVAPELSSVLLDEMRVGRSRSMLDEFRAERMVHGLDTDADKLHLALD